MSEFRAKRFGVRRLGAAFFGVNSCDSWVKFVAIRFSFLVNGIDFRRDLRQTWLR
jgi:hypothetical protein